MLSEKERKEMLEDTLSERRKKSFEESDKKAEEFILRHHLSLTVDEVIEFLMNAQKVTGPFPISKEVPAPPFVFRL